MKKKFILSLIILCLLNISLKCQTLVMNEVSNGPSGNMEYVEFVVSDTTVVYNCSGITNPPCIDIRGWIFDDNSGYHGAGGVAPGCIRFSNNNFWSCIPVGTIILIYNNLDPNSSLPPIDTLMSDGNCRLVVPVDKINWFDQNPTTPGALACSYPAAGWVPGGLWSNTLLANTGDCARIVNLSGCEVFSVCWGTVNTNTLIYFPASGQDRVYYFANSTNNDPNNQVNWVNGCADPGACGSNTQTPGAPNNPANAAWINSMNNNCSPISPLATSVNSTNGSCPCSASASVSAAGSIPPYSYTWTPAPGSGQGTSNASGLCSGTFTCYVESIPTGCTQSITVSVSNGTVGTTAANTGSYCSGSTIQLNTPAATSYTWSGPGGFSSSVQNPTISPSTPTMSGTYTVSAIIGQCLTTGTTDVLVNPTPTITVNSASLCSGQSTTLTAGSATSYTWNTGPTTATISISPTVTTNYTISGSASGCSNSTTTSVLVNPTPTVSANSPTLCVGQNTILTASGASTYSWNTGPTTTTISISPTVTTNYTVIGSSSANCTNTAITSVTVNPNPTITVNSAALCSGQSATLTAGGASTYTWNTGPTTATISISPTVTTNYTISGSSAGCSGSATSAVNVTPTPTLSPVSVTICPGNTATLSVSGASNYTWHPGSTTGPTYTASPANNTTYTIIGANGSCTTAATASVTIGAGISITANSPIICIGQSVALTASGATSYTWSTGENTASISVNPTVTTTYTIDGVNGLCSGTNTTAVTVNPLPIITPVPTVSVCAGQTATLTANGAVSYTWNPGLLSGSSVTVSPQANQSYTVTGSDANGCANTAIANVSVTPNPTISVPSQTICSGQTATLTAGGATSYTWNTGPTTTTISISPTVTTNYTVIGSSSANCTNTAITSVTVNPNPTITVNSAALCSGQSATLTAGGASTYTWNTGPTTATISISPTVTTNYTISGSSAGCSGSATSAVSVTPTPTLSPVSVTICPGNTATLSVSGASNYTWNPGSTTGPTYTASPANNTTYTIIGANGSCTTTATASVTIGAGISITANSPSICIGQSVALTASGATSYTWSTGENTASISVNPTVTTTYTIDGVNGLCSGTNTTAVTVNPLPIITPVPTVSVCAGQTATLTANGAVSYTWNPGLLSGSSVTVSPQANQSYTVTGSDANGCANTAIANVSVTPNPTISVPSQTICSGQTATLTAGGATSYTWIPGGSNSTTLAVSPVSSSVYTITGSTGSCTSAIASSVGVISSLTLTVNSPTICLGQLATLNAGGAVSYSWTGGPNTSTFAVTPTITTNYSLAGSIGTCTNNISTFVTVNNLPAPPIAQTNSIVCEGQLIILNGSGSAGTFSWSGPSGFNSSSAGATITPATSANAGTYTLTVTDANNCSNSSQAAISVTPLPMATVSSPATCLSNDLILNSSGGAIYAWTGPDNFNSDNQNVTIPNSSTNMAGTYTVMVTDMQGCTSARTIDIIIDKCQCPVFIPEGFSPNSDGAHDLFVISCVTDRPTKVEIYNRWGNLVYKSDDYKNDWNGKNNAGLTVGGEDLPAGTYYYIIKISDEDKSRTGFVTLWR